MKNMYKYLIVFLSITLTTNLFSQTDSIYTDSYKLEGEAWQNWDSIYQYWMNNVYHTCLEENNLKMSCANCVYVYIDAGLSINENGKVTDIKIFKENICSKKASEKLKLCFFNYFKNLVFPEALRNRKILGKFGTGLKC